jgi:hypothetical protein
MGRTESLGGEGAGIKPGAGDPHNSDMASAMISESAKMGIVLLAQSGLSVKLITESLIWEALSTRQEQVRILLKQMSDCIGIQQAGKFLPTFERAYRAFADKDLSLDVGLSQLESSVVAQVGMNIQLLPNDEQKKSLIEGFWADLEKNEKMWVILNELDLLEQNMLEEAQSLAQQLGNSENLKDLGRDFSIRLLFARLKEGTE